MADILFAKAQIKRLNVSKKKLKYRNMCFHFNAKSYIKLYLFINKLIHIDVTMCINVLSNNLILFLSFE